MSGEEFSPLSWRFFFDYVIGHHEGIVFVITACTLVPMSVAYEDHVDRLMIIILGMGICYATAALPIIGTTLIPLIAFPLLNIMSSQQTYQLYFKDTFVMFSGYYAAAVEYSGLHIRASYAVLSLVGCSPRRVHFAICIVIMFLSMWITNTACAAMMIAVVDAILTNLHEVGLCKLWADEDMDLPENMRRPSLMKSCFYLSVVYSASIGGIGCVIGSPTNFVISSVYKHYFLTCKERDKVGKYMLYHIPIMITCTLLMYLDLEIVFMGLFRPESKDAKDVTFPKSNIELGWEVINEKYRALGPITTHEISVIALFGVLIGAYLTRNNSFITGWEWYLSEGEDPMNTVPEVCVMLLLFILPANYKFLRFWEAAGQEPTPCLLKYEFAIQKVSWSLIYLVGSGTALAVGSRLTGMDDRISQSLARNDRSNATMLLILITMVVLMTNVTSNITTANITMPILANIAGYRNIHPIYLMMPAGVACSMAFMLPGATPSLLLIREMGNLKRTTLLRGGFLPTITSILAIWLITSFWCPVIYPDINSEQDIRETLELANLTHPPYVTDTK